MSGESPRTVRGRGSSAATSRGDAAAETRIFRGDESRRRCGYDVDIPRRRVAATPRPRDVDIPWETSRGDAAAQRRGYSVEASRGDGIGGTATGEHAAVRAGQKTRQVPAPLPAIPAPSPVPAFAPPAFARAASAPLPSIAPPPATPRASATSLPIAAPETPPASPPSTPPTPMIVTAVPLLATGDDRERDAAQGAVGSLALEVVSALAGVAASPAANGSPAARAVATTLARVVQTHAAGAVRARLASADGGDRVWAVEALGDVCRALVERAVGWSGAVRYPTRGSAATTRGPRTEGASSSRYYAPRARTIRVLAAASARPRYFFRTVCGLVGVPRRSEARAAGVRRAISTTLERVPGPSFEALAAVTRAVEEASRTMELAGHELFEAETLDAFDPAWLDAAAAAPLLDASAPRRLDVIPRSARPSDRGLHVDEFLAKFLAAARADGAGRFILVATFDRRFDGDAAAYGRAMLMEKLAFIGRLLFKPPVEDDDQGFRWAAPSETGFDICRDPASEPKARGRGDAAAMDGSRGETASCGRSAASTRS